MAKAKAKVDRPKTECPVPGGPEGFAAVAQPQVVKVGEGSVVAAVKVFSSGSFGWYTNEKVTIMVDGKSVRVQAQIQLIVIGSKPDKE